MLRFSVEMEAEKRIDLFPDNQDYFDSGAKCRLYNQTNTAVNWISAETTTYIFLDGSARQAATVKNTGLADPNSWHGNYREGYSTFKSPISKIVSSGGSIEYLTASGFVTQSTATYSNGVYVETVLKDAGLFMIVGD